MKEGKQKRQNTVRISLMKIQKVAALKVGEDLI